MLRRVVLLSRSIGSSGLSTVSLAHILGAAERNNRRDQIGGALVLHGDRIVLAMEGPAGNVGRALERVRADARHTDVEVLVDAPVAVRSLSDPMRLCEDSERFLSAVGLTDLGELTADMAEAVLERRLAA